MGRAGPRTPHRPLQPPLLVHSSRLPLPLLLPCKEATMRTVISSGHGKYIRGASGILDEVNEARKVVEAVAERLRGLNVDTVTYHDDVSTTQSENLERIVDYHNAQGPHDLDISVHFNAYTETA